MLRFPLIILVLLVCLQLAPQALGQTHPDWQPYREATPAQYVQGTVATDLPVCPLTDADLQVLCQPCQPTAQSGCSPPVYVPVPYGDPVLAPLSQSEAWQWHILPSDVLWHSYWASAKEPRISGLWFNETQSDTALLDVSLGGRSSILRYGTYNSGRSEGWELQLEGAAILRLNLDNNWDFDLSDYRFGVPLVFSRGQQQWKFSYYHESSHLGDELAIRQPGILATRINYSRDVLVIGYSLFPIDPVRVYAEMGYSFNNDGGSKPWEFQFGLDLARPGPTGIQGTPFFAINGHLREELNYGGNLSTQLGWLWRGNSGKTLRSGLHYYNGKSPQFQRFNEFEQHIGVGLWHDF